MDLIDSEERFLQKAVGKKHNFSNCECGFFLSQPGFYIYYWKAIRHITESFSWKKLFLQTFPHAAVEKFYEQPKINETKPDMYERGFLSLERRM